MGREDIPKILSLILYEAEKMVRKRHEREGGGGEEKRVSEI